MLQLALPCLEGVVGQWQVHAATDTICFPPPSDPYLQVKARQGLNEQLNTIASSVLTIEPKHGADGQLSPASQTAADASGTFSSPQQSPRSQDPYSNGDHDTDGLFDVPLSTPAQHVGSAGSSLAKENAALKGRLQVVEEAAAEALGELQDLKDELEAHREARHAAERQVGAPVSRFADLWVWGNGLVCGGGGGHVGEGGQVGYSNEAVSRTVRPLGGCRT